MLERLSTNSHQPDTLPLPIRKIWKQALNGDSHVAKRLHKNLCRGIWFFSIKSLLKTLPKVLAKVKLLVHYEYWQSRLPCCSLFPCALLPIKMHLFIICLVFRLQIWRERILSFCFALPRCQAGGCQRLYFGYLSTVGASWSLQS